jgi:hypothetical protein
MILKHALPWLASFVAISAVDALWHLGLWGKVCGASAGLFIPWAGRVLKVY